MVLHMLAVFGRETAHPPTLIESPSALAKAHHPVLEEEAEAQDALCESALDHAYGASKAAGRHKQLLGKGSGFSYEASPYCSYAEQDGIHVVFMGEVSDWPGVNAVSAAHDAFVRNDPPLEMDDAHWLLDFYGTFQHPGDEGGASSAAERALECLARVSGSFAFVIYDSVLHRVLAARDAHGSQPLFWGTTDDGQLMFGTVGDDLTACYPSAAPFPAGTLFASERHTVAYCPGRWGWVIADDESPGQLLSFVKSDKERWRHVKAIPRITSKGVMCGAVYKVASQPNIAAL